MDGMELDGAALVHNAIEQLKGQIEFNKALLDLIRKQNEVQDKLVQLAIRIDEKLDALILGAAAHPADPKRETPYIR